MADRFEVLENVLGLDRSDLRGLSREQTVRLAFEVLDSMFTEDESGNGRITMRMHEAALRSISELHSRITGSGEGLVRHG